MFVGVVGNDVKAFAFSPTNTQVALVYHYSGIMPNQLCLIDGLPGQAIKTCRSISGASFFHFMAYLTDTYLAFATWCSECDPIAFNIEDGTSCRLPVWYARGGTCATPLMPTFDFERTVKVGQMHDNVFEHVSYARHRIHSMDDATEVWMVWMFTGFLL
jgi:hypothetical protein